MRPVLLLLTLVSFGDSSPTRLRDFFNSIKEFANKEGQTASPDSYNSIIGSALRYANSNGRDLDNFVNALTIVCLNKIAVRDLDRIGLDALERLFHQRMAESVSSNQQGHEVIEKTTMEQECIGGQIVERQMKEEQSPPELSKDVQKAESEDESLNRRSTDVVKAESEVESLNRRSPDVAKAESIEPQLKEERSRSAPKRPIDNYNAESRKTVEWILKRAESLPEPPNIRLNRGTDLLNYMNYKLAENGDFEQLLYHLTLLGAADKGDGTQYVIHLFEDAFKKLMNPSYVWRNGKLDEALRSQERFLNVRPSRIKIVERLRTIRDKADGEYKKPFGIVSEMERRVFEMTKNRNYSELLFALQLYENAGFSNIKKRTLFQRSLDWLERLIDTH